MFETILFPIDRSQESFIMANNAIHLDRSQKSRMIMLSVKESDQADKNNPESKAILLRKTGELIEESEINCDAIKRENKPAFVVYALADEVDTQRIVIGSQENNVEEDAETTTSHGMQIASFPVLIIL